MSWPAVLLDRAIATAARRASAPGGILFTERQLFYEVCRVLRPLPRLPRRPRFTVAAPLAYESFRAALRRRGSISGLLPDPPAATVAYDGESDIYDYGLPRLLLCQDPAIAAMLRANDLPMESACPVFSLPDLPLDPRLVTMLSRADNPAVFLLHDTDPAGAAMSAAVRMPARVRVVPLGLRPRQAAGLHLTRSPDTDAVEIAAVRPATLLRTVHRLVRGVRREPGWSLDLRRARETGFLTWPAA